MDGMDGMHHDQGMHDHGMMPMHVTFYWGKDAAILFSGWPGHSPGMYVLALFFVFALSVTVEGLSASRFIKPGSNRFSAGLAQTALHAIRIGLAYLVMLAVMSFNAGVLIVAVLGHAVGFFVFASRAFSRSDPGDPSQKGPI